MMKTRRTTLATALAAFGVAACGGTTAPDHDDYDALPADQVFVGVEHAMTNNGVRQSLLKSDTTHVFNDSSTIRLRGVNLTMYTEDGQVRATLTSSSGELDQNTNRMVARGTVVLTVRGENASTITTEELHYDPSQKRIWSDVPTRRVTPAGEVQTMEGFNADDQFRNFSARGGTATGLRIRLEG
jgi:LPS export ABC transporter protein LptC